jgi:hypothetical protein
MLWKFDEGRAEGPPPWADEREWLPNKGTGRSQAAHLTTWTPLSMAIDGLASSVSYLADHIHDAPLRSVLTN